MIEFKKDCYAAYVSEDEMSSRLFGYFTNYDDAIECSKGKGWWGADGTASKTVIHIKIYESRTEFDGVTTEDEKKAAISKLTDRERKLLGL